MSKVAVTGNNSGTGVFTIAAPNSNTDRTLTLPDEEGTVATIENIPPGYEDQDALDLFNVTGSAPVYACRAWVNFDGTGTVSIRDSGNVSSITDNGTGDFTVNFATAMPDANYSIGTIPFWLSSHSKAREIHIQASSDITSSNLTVHSAFESSGDDKVFSDPENVSLSIFR